MCLQAVVAKVISPSARPQENDVRFPFASPLQTVEQNLPRCSCNIYYSFFFNDAPNEESDVVLTFQFILCDGQCASSIHCDHCQSQRGWGVGRVGVEGMVGWQREMGKREVILVVMALCEGAMITLLMLMFASAASGGRSVEPQSAAWRQVNLLSVLHRCLMIRST